MHSIVFEIILYHIYYIYPKLRQFHNSSFLNPFKFMLCVKTHGSLSIFLDQQNPQKYLNYSNVRIAICRQKRYNDNLEKAIEAGGISHEI